jgi:hypothetical protein
VAVPADAVRVRVLGVGALGNAERPVLDVLARGAVARARAVAHAVALGVTPPADFPRGLVQPKKIKIYIKLSMIFS